MTDQTPDRRQGRPIAIPKGRLNRMARLGGVASSIAGNMAIEGARRLSRGERPEARSLLLSPANIARLTDELARMRGAAMKMGQLISMDAGDVLPPELAAIMARLRDAADFMPPKQLRSVLTAEWGNDWLGRFARFDPRPVAAASIGQVHRALTRDGRDLAIKVQYPGVKASIGSDVANVGALIRVSGLLPKGFDLAPLLDEAKAQLHEEADYAREAAMLARYAALVGADPGFRVPDPYPDLSTASVLAMRFEPGLPIEEAAFRPQAERDAIMTRLVELTLREVFDFGLIQSDPNFANYRFDPGSGRIVLLDFGAAREVPGRLADGYRAILAAGLSGDAAGLRDAALRLGFFADDSDERHVGLILDMIRAVFDALRACELLDFADRKLADRLRGHGMALAEARDFTHIPPIDTLFLQRKFAGLFLLGARLEARVPVRSLIARHS